MLMDTKTEAAINVRKQLIEVLLLWSSAKKQLEYQKNAPIADVASELFCQWQDDCYHPESELFALAFNAEELLALKTFDQTISHISARTPTNLPDIHTFVKSGEWETINEAAIEALKKLSITNIF